MHELPQPLRLHLRDRTPEIVLAWREHFGEAGDVEISCGDIFGAVADAIVSPANSFGFMDGGIDLAYSLRFGWALQDRLQALLRDHHDGELPVGQAVVVATEDQAIPWVVSAPTMRVPMNVAQTVNAFLAFRAALRAVKDFNRDAERPIRSLLCPGLGTSVGAMEPSVCARQMHYAYATSLRGHVATPLTLGAACDAHDRLRG